jgi:hypothetical protein
MNVMSPKEEYYRRRATQKAEIEKKLSDGWKAKLKDPVNVSAVVFAKLR